MTDVKKHFVNWLRDAHAMEEQAVTMLNGQAGRIENYPSLKQRVEEHARESESQVKALEGLLARLDTSSSTVKDTTGKAAALGHGIGGMLSHDEVMKGVISNYAFEHFEIASYKVLIATAEQLGDSEAASVLRGILDQEQAMADWLDKNTDQITRDFLTRDAAGQTAKA